MAPRSTTLAAVLVARWAATRVAAVCEDDASFVDELGNACAAWAGADCETAGDYTESGRRDVFKFCGATCGTCVLANDFCTAGRGGDTLEVDLTSSASFDIASHPLLSGTCDWDFLDAGLYQSSNAWGNPDINTLMGCMALVSGVEYTDFVLEADVRNFDNDGVGLVFGYSDIDAQYIAHMINDEWPDIPADGVSGPSTKIRKHNGKPVLEVMNATTTCFDTLSWTATLDGNNGQALEDYPGGRLASHAYIPDEYAQEYMPFAQSSTMTMTLVVKNKEARFYFKSASGETVGTWARLPDDYAGGQVGFFTFAHQPLFTKLRITDISDGATALEGTNKCLWGGTCNTVTGLCENEVVVTPTPTASPTLFPTATFNGVAVAASDVCPNPVGGDVVEPDMTSLASFITVEHPKLSAPCGWTADAEGLYQSSNAWGNPGDNTLMGCMALYNDQEFTDFIAEVEISHADNDGVGFVFGYNEIDDHYLAIAINDRWPEAPADGVGGPFLKIKRHNGGEVLDEMDASNNVFDLMAYVDSTHVSDEMVDAPLEYVRKYPYATSAPFQSPMKLTLIVKNGEARVMFPAPDFDTGNTENRYRQGNQYVGAWTKQLGSNYGGKIGFFTYAHQATFSNLKITDLSSSVPDAYCGAHEDAHCDPERGVCVGVPASGFCEDPSNPTYHDTQSLDTFDLIEDPALSAPCNWIIEGDGHIRQTSNAWGSPGDNTLTGCNAVLKEPEYTDFIAQVRIDHNDNDGVGFVFGWQSVDDHFKAHKINDQWPQPAADMVHGPMMKIKRRDPQFSCAQPFMDATNNCFITLGFADADGVHHDGMPAGAVAPDVYTNRYIPYDQFDHTVMTLIVKGNTARVMFKATSGKVVGAFAFDLPDYSGGRVGLFTYAHQAQFSQFSVTPLDEAGPFCGGDRHCLPSGVCGDPLPTAMPTGTPTPKPTPSPTPSPTPMPTTAAPSTAVPTPAPLKFPSGKKKKSSSGASLTIIIVVVVVLVVIACCVGVGAFLYGKKTTKEEISKNTVDAVPTENFEIVESKEGDRYARPVSGAVQPGIAPGVKVVDAPTGTHEML
mmetsp:Transcript_25703/g.102556  ORF Transcript_25703/g.102556 Transcript_25703/m.102556 type:complete len:1067 (-) Transcript_25703:274-3474(-)